MSDLGRLFRLRGAPNLEPLENFSTEALAIAIGHDDRPMRHALRAVDWTCEEEDGRPVQVQAPFDLASADLVSVTAKTQTLLCPGPDVQLGYLDLVLSVIDAKQRRSTIWIEVKVDAWESGFQLANYKKHAALRSPCPAVITLGRTRVSQRVPALKWSDIVDAIMSTPNPHDTWVRLRDFLRDEKIVAPLMPPEPVGHAGAHIEIIVKVNGLLRTRWPASSMFWRDTTLRGTLHKSYSEHQELVTSGGPLRYGLMPGKEVLPPAAKSWEWGLCVTTKNYEGVRLDARQMLEDAEIEGLPEDWLRYTDRSEVLERRVSLKSCSSQPDILAWFNQGIKQLVDANILSRYFLGVEKKAAAVAAKAKAAEVKNNAETHQPDGAIVVADVNDDGLAKPA